MPEVDGVRIQSIKGIPRQAAKDSSKRFFAVYAQYRIEVEGISAKFWSREQRVVVVWATSFKNAEARFKQMDKGYDEPYLNPQGEIVQWVREKIFDVYDTGEQEIMDGTEVFSMVRKTKATE